MASTTGTSQPEPRPHMRMTILKEALLSACRDCTTTMPFRQFSSCFQGQDPNVVEVLYQLYQQVLFYIRANAELEFESILDDLQIGPQLSKIDQLCLQHSLTQQGGSFQQHVDGAYSKQPASIVRNSALHLLRAERDRLREILARQEDEKRQLSAELQAILEKARRSGSSIDGTAAEMDGLYQACRGCVASDGQTDAVMV